MEAARHTLATYFADAPQVSSPAVAGPLAVFPLIGPEPTLVYQSFAQAHGVGVSIKELGGGASVNDLVISNPTDLPILLFEGEEVLGAQQNRTFDVSVLVPPRTTLHVPVSCVEAGRWDGSRHDESFAPAPQAAYPSLRRLKNEHASRMVAIGAAARADQSAVWHEVDTKLDSLAADAPTRAMHDGYEARRREIDGMVQEMELRPGQTGMLVAIGGTFTVLDRVSQPDVLGSLFKPLVQGYALDAISVLDGQAPSLDEAKAFLERVLATPLTERDAIGLGRDARIAGGEIAGAGVVHGDELVQLSAFVREGRDDVQPIVAGRIRRPSRRR